MFERLFQFALKRHVAPVLLIIPLLAIYFFGRACINNYETTYAQLSQIMPSDFAWTFTGIVQVTEFLVPLLVVLRIMDALAFSLEMRIGTYVLWAAACVIDFVTAYQFFISAYPAPGVLAVVVSIGSSALFLVAELFVAVSIYAAMVLVWIIWKGYVPQWLKDPDSMTVEMPQRPAEQMQMPPDNVTPEKALRRGRHNWIFCECTDGKVRAFPSGDPRLIGIPLPS